jgi:hypothetical protein
MERMTTSIADPKEKDIALPGSTTPARHIQFDSRDDTPDLTSDDLILSNRIIFLTSEQTHRLQYIF